MTARGPQTMISVGIAGTLFLYRTAAICIADGRVLLSRAPDAPFWHIPGGRVHAGESSIDALKREIGEELGVEPAVGRLLFVAENFFDFGEEHLQELGLYFAITLPEGSEPLSWAGSVHRTESGDGQALEWAWHSLTEVDGLDIRPPYLKASLRALPEHPVHIVERRSL